MYYITGDTHGDFSRIERFCREMHPDRNDVMIILGDAGFNYYGNWRDGEFSVSQGSLKVKSLKQGEESIDEISFKLVGRQRIT